MKKMARQYTITKKIAKQGNRSIIVIPSILNDQLRPSTIVKITIDVIKEADLQ
jgi:antitoxin component of MazEF toxin-antitoxin module